MFKKLTLTTAAFVLAATSVISPVAAAPVAPIASTCAVKQIAMSGACKNFTISGSVAKANEYATLIGRFDNGLFVFYRQNATTNGRSAIIVKSTTVSNTYYFTATNGGYASPVVIGNTVYVTDANADLNRTYVYKLDRALGRFVKIRTINTFIQTFISYNFMDSTQTYLYIAEMSGFLYARPNLGIRTINVKTGAFGATDIMQAYNNTLPAGSTEQVRNISAVDYENGYFYVMATDTKIMEQYSKYKILKVEAANLSNVSLFADMGAFGGGSIKVKNDTVYVSTYVRAETESYLSIVTPTEIKTLKALDMVKAVKPTSNTTVPNTKGVRITLNGVDQYGNAAITIGGLTPQDGYSMTLMVSANLELTNITTIDSVATKIAGFIKGNFYLSKTVASTSTGYTIGYQRMNIAY
jgi:hypothetical protein